MVKCFVSKKPEIGSFILRFTIGILFLYAGVGKVVLGGAVGLSGLLWGQLWLAYLVGMVEVVAGAFLILGFLSRQSSVALIIIVVFAIYLAHNPFTMEGELMNALIRLTLIGGLAQILFQGSGKIALQED